MFVHNSGKLDYFCTNRCEKNLFKLHRSPLQTRWTKKYALEHGRSGKNKL